MRKIRKVLRLCWGLGLPVRQTARSVGVAASTVSDLLYRAKAAGLAWPLPESMGDQALEALLYPTPAPSSVQRPAPDMEWVHRDGSYSRLLRWLSKVDVLVLDEWGLTPLTVADGRELLEVIENRCETG